jgi:hypothetical protein
VRDLEELFGSSSLKWKDEMDIKDLNLTVKASTEEPNRQVVVRLGDFQMLKVWIGGNRSHIRVQDTDAKSTDVETQSDEEGADLTNEEWWMLKAQVLEIQEDDKDYDDHLDGLDDDCNPWFRW